MQPNNAKMVSSALRNKVLDKLGNETISSKEVNVLIEELGGIVVSLQTLYFAEILKVEKRMTGMIEELNTSIAQYLDELANNQQKQQINVQIDPESIAKALTHALVRRPFSQQ